MRTTVIILIISIFGCLQFACQSGNEDKSIVIVQTTDIHGTIFPYDFINDKPIDHSLASVATYVKELRTEYPEGTILLDNGDYFQGQPAVYYYNYEDTSSMNVGAEVLNYLNYDAITIGNHDIECGHPVYDKLRKELNAPWLAANVINTATGEPYFKPYAIIERGGIKVAVLGLTTPAIPSWLPEDIWRGMEFEDMIESATKWEKIIREKEQPDLLIGMFHSGINFEYNNETAETFKNENATMLVAKNVPGFDIILAGHDHKAFLDKVVNITGDTVVVIDPMSHARAVASIKVAFKFNSKSNTWDKSILPSIIEMKDYEPDQEFLTKFKTNYEEIKSYVSKQIGEVSTSMKTKEAYFGNSTFIDFIHKVQLEYSKADLSFSAPLSFENTIEKGPIYVRDLFKLYKYENLLYTMALTGREIDGFLEYSYGQWLNKMKSEADHLLLVEKDTNGKYNLINRYYNFSSASGIEYVVDVKRPDGERVHILGFSNGNHFFQDSTYSVALNSYRGNGGGGHLTLGAGIEQEELPKRIIKSSEHDLRFIIMEYIKTNEIVSPKKGTNWRIIPENYYEKGKLKDYRLLFE